MSGNDFDIRAQSAQDVPAIEALLDEAFGQTRRQKTAYRLRETGAAAPGLSFVAQALDRLVGAIQFWPIVIGEKMPALLLGPLAVARDFKQRRCGIALMRHGLEVARRKHHKLVILVGDEAYYGKVGFTKIPQGRVTMPGPVDPDRLLVCELERDIFVGVSGLVAAQS